MELKCPDLLMQNDGITALLSGILVFKNKQMER
jgi:hypothetical protein